MSTDYVPGTLIMITASILIILFSPDDNNKIDIVIHTV